MNKINFNYASTFPNNRGFDKSFVLTNKAIVAKNPIKAIKKNKNPTAIPPKPFPFIRILPSSSAAAGLGVTLFVGATNVVNSL